MTARSTDIAQARRGFTLAELVIVMAIMATLAAIAVPRFASANATFRVDGAARQLAAAIEDAAAQARARSTTVRVRVSKDGNNYSAAVLSPLTYLKIYDTTDRPFSATIERALNPDGPSRLDINGFGEFSNPFIVELKVASHSRCVWVDPDSGTVNIGSLEEAKAFE